MVSGLTHHQYKMIIFTGDTLFQVKKSSHSKKVAKELKKKSQKEKESEEIKVKEEPVSPDVTVKKEPGLDHEKIKVKEPFQVLDSFYLV